MSMEPKYLVMKMEDARHLDEVVAEAHSLPPESYFVIRQGDVFGAPALHAYAHTLMTALELDEAHAFLTGPQREHLTELVDGLTEMAASWSARSRGVPD